MFLEGEERERVGWESRVLAVSDLEIHDFILFTNSRVEITLSNIQNYNVWKKR